LFPFSYFFFLFFFFSLLFFFSSFFLWFLYVHMLTAHEKKRRWDESLLGIHAMRKRLLKNVANHYIIREELREAIRELVRYGHWCPTCEQMRVPLVSYMWTGTELSLYQCCHWGARRRHVLKSVSVLLMPLSSQHWYRFVNRITGIAARVYTHYPWKCCDALPTIWHIGRCD
jgi:hypothetical protein